MSDLRCRNLMCGVQNAVPAADGQTHARGEGSPAEGTPFDRATRIASPRAAFSRLPRLFAQAAAEPPKPASATQPCDCVAFPQDDAALKKAIEGVMAILPALKDEKMKYSAAAFLLHICEPSARCLGLKALLQLLADAQDETVQRRAGVLLLTHGGRQESEASTKVLRHLMIHARDPFDRIAAAENLQYFGDAASQREGRNMLRHLSASAATDRIRFEAADSVHYEERATRLLALLEASRDDLVRVDAARRLVPIADEKAKARALGIVATLHATTSVERARADAARILYGNHLETAKALASLAHLASTSKDEAVRRRAAEMLVRNGDPVQAKVGTKVLRELLTHAKSDEVRFSAATDLLWWEDDPAIIAQAYAVITTVARSAVDEELRLEAANELYRKKNDPGARMEGRATMLPLLERAGDWQVRYSALKILMRSPGKKPIAPHQK
jgi:hypothetical protein